MLDYSVSIWQVDKPRTVINTYRDWYMVPDGPPVITMPECKTNYVEIPGASGHIDLSETLTKYPLYGVRKGNIKFIGLDEFTVERQNPYPSKVELRNKIANFIHGKRVCLLLSDDDYYYYEGRMALSDWTPGKNSGPSITLEYEFDPYKYYYYKKELVKDSSTSSSGWVMNTETIGRMPVDAVYTVSNIGATGISIEVTNEELGIANRVKNIRANGTYKFYDMTLSNISGTNNCTLHITGDGYVVTSYRKGDL